MNFHTHQARTPRSRSAVGLVLAPLLLFFALGACSKKEEPSVDQGSQCPSSAGALLSYKGDASSSMGSFGLSPKPYEFQPKTIQWEDESGGAGLQVQSLSGGPSAYVVVYDRTCALNSPPEDLAFPEVVGELMERKTRFSAVEVEVFDFRDHDLRMRVEEDPCLKGLGPNQEVSLLSYGGQIRSSSLSVDDPLFIQQEQHEFIKTQEGWEEFYHGTRGISEVVGKEVIVAIVDSGVNYSHEDLAGQMWDDGMGNHGWNVVASSSDPMDDHGHGTHVAGLVAAEVGNSLGGGGVAPRHVQIMAVKVLNGSGSGSLAGVIEGINFAADNGAHVINLSLGMSGTNSSLQAALTNAIAQGAFIVAAAGNSGNNISEPSTAVIPAFYGSEIQGMLTVGSLDTNSGARSYFSNYSKTRVEIFAPGSHGFVSGSTVGLLSTVDVGSAATYDYMPGTSMAAPLIAGAAALTIAYFKEWDVDWTPAMVEAQFSQGSPTDCGLWDYGVEGRFLDLKILSERVKATVGI